MIPCKERVEQPGRGGATAAHLDPAGAVPEGLLLTGGEHGDDLVQPPLQAPENLPRLALLGAIALRCGHV